MYKSILTIFVLLLIVGCNPGQKENPRETKEQIQAIKTSTDSSVYEQTMETEVTPDSVSNEKPSLYQTYYQLKAMHDRLPYFLPVDSAYLFITVMGEWSEYDVFYRKTYIHQMGLINEKNEPVLPVRYHHLGNPGIYGKYWIEIQQNQNKGLFNLKSKQLVNPIYDMVIPAEDSTIIAYAIKEEQHFTIDLEGNQKEVEEIPNSLKFLGLKKGSLFDIGKIGIIPYYTSGLFYSEEEQPMDELFKRYEEGAGVIYAPLYLTQLDVTNPVFTSIEVKEQAEGERYIITEDSESSVSFVSDITDGIKAFFTKFIESGTDARGYFIENERLVTVNQRNQLIDSMQLTRNYNEALLKTTESYSLLGDTLIEIIKDGGGFLEYLNFPQYSYQWIQQTW
ncbi:MAG: hypothetical protein AAFQ94_31650 [Bacteroidota bacterium]